MNLEPDVRQKSAPLPYDPTDRASRLAVSDKSMSGLKGRTTYRLVHPTDPIFNMDSAELITMYNSAISKEDYAGINGDIFSFIQALTENAAWEGHTYKTYTDANSLHNSLEAIYSKKKQNRQLYRSASNLRMMELRKQIKEDVEFVISGFDLEDDITKYLKSNIVLEKGQKYTDEQLREAKEAVKHNMTDVLFEERIKSDVDYQQNASQYEAVRHDDIVAYIHIYRARFKTAEEADMVDSPDWMPINQIYMCRFETIEDIEFINNTTKAFPTRNFNGEKLFMKPKFVRLGA